MNHRQLGTVLAALRYWQKQLDPQRIHSKFNDCMAIATNNGGTTPLEVNEIDALCEELNTAQSIDEMVDGLCNGAKPGPFMSKQSAIRDILTDIRHYVDRHNLDIKAAMEGSEAVYKEELEGANQDD